MNITDKDGKWKVEARCITDRKANEVRQVSGIPQDNSIANMHQRTFMRKCAEAFASGEWPS